MLLPDGSRAFLSRDARLRVLEQDARIVHVAQSSGEVGFEVPPDASTEFVVDAPSVTVRVWGAAFAVDVRRDRVRVSVERGAVEVDDGVRSRELVGGESLAVPRPERPPGPEVMTQGVSWLPRLF
jgi:ferric-dicitrate binding protein FerR (iron transport regulator)